MRMEGAVDLWRLHKRIGEPAITISVGQDQVERPDIWRSRQQGMCKGSKACRQQGRLALVLK
jgi:hypothetical protein